MEYDKLTEDQKEYLRGLNEIRATLANVAYNLQQQVANLTSDLIEYATPRESVWNAIENEDPEHLRSIQWLLKDAHYRLERYAEQVEVIRSIAQKKHNELRRALRDLDPTIWKSRLNGPDAKPEPARDAAEDIFCERNED